MVGPRRTCPHRRRGHPQAAGPQDPRAGRVDGRARPVARAPTWTSPSAARRRASRSGPPSTRELLEHVRAHRSTIVFVNSRRGAERLALRLNELAGRGDLARAHHGSLAREERTVVEEMLKAGRAAVPDRHLVARARHRHGRRRPRAAGRVAQVGRARAAAHRARRALGRRHEQGPHLPQVPRRPARVRGGRQAHARGAHRADRRAAQRARRAGAADRRHRGRRRARSRCPSTSCSR